MKVTFEADTIKVNGPLAHGGSTVSLSVGQYSHRALAALILMANTELLTFTVEIDDGRDPNAGKPS